jgi:molybdopterin converting factor small subunit
VEIIIFGQLTDITGSSLSVESVADTNELIRQLHQRYPALADRKYLIAVNKKAVQENTQLEENSIVALLPPFSGG